MPGARIAHRKNHLVGGTGVSPVYFGGQCNSAARGRMGQGVVEHVLQGMLKLLGVGGHHRQIAGHAENEVHAPIGRPRPDQVRRRFQERGGPLGPKAELAAPPPAAPSPRDC